MAVPEPEKALNHAARVGFRRALIAAGMPLPLQTLGQLVDFVDLVEGDALIRAVRALVVHVGVKVTLSLQYLLDSLAAHLGQRPGIQTVFFPASCARRGRPPTDFRSHGLAVRPRAPGLVKAAFRGLQVSSNALNMWPMNTSIHTSHSIRVLSLAGLAAAVLPALMLASCSSTPEIGYIPRVVPEIDTEAMTEVTYQDDIQPLFNRRCVACHSCFDAPAQLKLNCSDGVVRGASKQRVYETRLKQAQHTRLHVDAQTEEEWREKGFFPVLPDPEASTIEERLDSSVLYQMLAMSRIRQLPESGLLDGIVRDSHDIPVAPSIDEFALYAYQFPHAGMPFYTYGLTEEEFSTFAHWTANGAPVEKETTVLTEWEQVQVNKWETLLNGDSKKDQLIARYIYDHWFSGNLYFSDAEEPVFFRMVRSKTPPGEPMDRVTTGCPTDDPGVDRVYYHLKKRHGVLMRKTHMPYALNDEKRDRLRALFWDTDWDVEELPPYGGRWKERPFDVFSAIPERSRYQFLLDDSYYFVQSFMRGPVCRGQVALNGIRDHFSILFVDPDKDPSCSHPEFLERAKDDLVLPSQISKLTGALFGYPIIKSRLKNFQNNWALAFNTFYPEGSEISLASVWDGADSPGEPLMTAFRHFDTASVAKGFVGATPPSAWLVDYTLLERIHYLLVANYDVFGTVAHQLSTRLYFDLLRYEGEINYMHLLPPEQREEIFRNLYRGVSERKLRKNYPLPQTTSRVAIAYSGEKDPRDQLRDLLVQRDSMARPGPGAAHRSLARVHEEIPQSMAHFVQYFPEVVFVRIRMNDGDDEVYTILRNKAHKNVAYLFGEENLRDPKYDSLLVLPGLVGDYPNLMMVLGEDDVDGYLEKLHQSDSFDKIVDCYLSHGVLRNSPEFWPTLDWFVDWQQKADPVQAGLFDLKHYFLTRLLSLGEGDLVKTTLSTDPVDLTQAAPR